MSMVGKNRAPRFSFEDYGISGARYVELRDNCRSGKYDRNLLIQSCVGIQKEVAVFIIKSVEKNKSYDRLEYDAELGRIPCGRTDFYGYRRAFYHNLNCLLLDKQKACKDEQQE